MKINNNIWVYNFLNKEISLFCNSLYSPSFKAPSLILEKAIRNISPRVQLKAKRIGGATYQVPTLLSKYRATNTAVKWLVEFSKRRTGKGIALKLANELIEAAKGMGNSIKKKDETHKMAEANKAFAQFR